MTLKQKVKQSWCQCYVQTNNYFYTSSEPPGHHGVCVVELHSTCIKAFTYNNHMVYTNELQRGSRIIMNKSFFPHKIINLQILVNWCKCKLACIKNINSEYTGCLAIVASKKISKYKSPLKLAQNFSKCLRL